MANNPSLVLSSAKKLVLHEDIMEEILLRLPTLSIIRFKTVCKRWHNLLSDPKFVKEHTKMAIYNNNISLINLSGYRHSYTVEPVAAIKEKYDSIPHQDAANKKAFEEAVTALISASMRHAPDELPWSVSLNSSTSDFSNIQAVEIFNPFNAPLASVKTLGSCNGLLLVSVKLETYLWNPATRDILILPSRTRLWLRKRKIMGNHDFVGNYVSITGLGYNSTLDEYKAVHLSVSYTYGPQCVMSLLLIFSSRSGVWKEVDYNLPYCFCNKYSCSAGLTINGFPHWTVHEYSEDVHMHGTKNLILYFDSADEKFKEVPTPIGWSEYFGFSPCPEFSPQLAHLKRCLCVVFDNSYAHNGRDVWIMNEYGVVESWTKLFVIKHPPTPSSYWSYVPLGFANNGDEVVMKAGDWKIVTYNMKTGRIQFVFGTSNANGPQSYEYVASLVSPRNFMHPA